MDKLKPCPFCGEVMNFNPSSGEIIGWHKDDCFLLWLELDESRDMTNEEIVTEFSTHGTEGQAMRDYEELVKRLREEAREADTFKLMEDLFEAADAIEDLQKPLDVVNDANNEGYDVGYWAGRQDYEPKWIPVKERPLTEPVNYITMTNARGKDNGVIAQKFVKTTIRGKPVERWEWCGRISPWTVTHYMQMPKPPKEET